MCIEVKSNSRIGHSILTGRRGFAAVVLAAIFAVSMSISPAQAQENPQVKAAMASLKEMTGKLGAPKVEGEALMFGTSKINDDFTVVDAVKAKHGGTATLFVKRAPNFVRVSTNVVKDGKRAIGTILDPNGPAIAAIRQGSAFYGPVDILGKIYDTGYEPIKAADGEVIGVYYVGFSLE